MKLNWFTNTIKVIKQFLSDWLIKYTFVNIGWLAGFLIFWIYLGWLLSAGICLGIFLEKNRQQLIKAWDDIFNPEKK